MSEATSASTGSARRWVLLAALAMCAVAGALWARFGGAVFAEMLTTAWAMCF